MMTPYLRVRMGSDAIFTLVRGENLVCQALNRLLERLEKPSYLSLGSFKSLLLPFTKEQPQGSLAPDLRVTGRESRT